MVVGVGATVVVGVGATVVVGVGATVVVGAGAGATVVVGVGATVVVVGETVVVGAGAGATVVVGVGATVVVVGATVVVVLDAAAVTRRTKRITARMFTERAKGVKYRVCCIYMHLYVISYFHIFSFSSISFMVSAKRSCTVLRSFKTCALLRSASEHSLFFVRLTSRVASHVPRKL